MGRVVSSLAESENQFRVSRPKRGDPPDYRRGLKRNGNWKATLKRSRIKRESKGHKVEMAKYNASAGAFFEEPGNDVCQICVRLREDGDNIILRTATERHHVFGRIGRLLNWRPGWMASCFFHRLWPHQNPTRARRLGILCPAAQWNTFPSAGD